MKKVVVLEENDPTELEKSLEKLINGNDIFHDDFGELISINYSYNREADFHIVSIYSVLVIYETKNRRR